MFGITRDGALLWFLAGAALVAYMVSVGIPPTQWTYAQWLQFASAFFAWGVGKLQSSPAPSSSEVSAGIRDSGKPLALLLAVGLSVAASGCATGGARHVVTVSVVSAHAVLSTIQDQERAAVCGVPTAPQPPACVPQETHQKISADLVKAFDADGRAAQLVRDVPPGVALPATLGELVNDINAAVARILAAIPESTFKTALIARLGSK